MDIVPPYHNSKVSQKDRMERLSVKTEANLGAKINKGYCNENKEVIKNKL